MTRELNELKKQELKKDWKSTAYQYGIGLIVFEFISGTVLILNKNLQWFEQFLLLFHMLLGFLLIISIVAFYLRLKLYLKVWNGKGFSLLGWATLVSFLISFMTGAVLFFTGITGLYGLWLVHVVSSYLFSAAFLWFVGAVIVFSAKESGARQRRAFLKMLRFISLRIAFIFALVWSASYLWAKSFSIPKLTVTVGNYRLPFKKDPFFPSSVKTDNGALYRKDVFANSQSCGVSGCHETINRQWEDSTHFRTPNPFVRAVQVGMIESGKKEGFFTNAKTDHIKKLNQQFPAREVYRKCAACHAPVALVSGNVGNHTAPESDEEFEGVSCSTCHSLEAAGFKGGGDYTIVPQPQYIFYYNTNPVAQYLHNVLVKNKPDLHKKAYTKSFYKETTACVGCHERLHFKSWQESAYNNVESPAQTKHCQTCHMPDVRDEYDISAKEKGFIKDHRFLSGGLTMAKLYKKEEQYNKTKEFLQDKKIDTEIIVPAKIRSGSEMNFIVRNINTGVGHNFPAGPEADIVEAWVHVTIKDVTGKILFERGQLGDDNILDKKENFVYYSQPVDANGKELELDRHRSWLFVSDKHQVIAPRMFHDVPFTFKIPPGFSGKLLVEASLNYRKPNQEFANWALGHTNFKVPHVAMDSDREAILLTENMEEHRIAEQDFIRAKKLDVLPGGLRKMHSFPKPEKQLDVESRVVLHHVHDLLKDKKMREAQESMESLGTTVRKTKIFRETMDKVKNRKTGGP